MNQKLPEEFRTEANNSLDLLVHFREEIRADLDELHAKADSIKIKFAEKIHFQGLQRGFLMSPLAEYEKCLTFDRKALERLL
jgi:hypothetical protein